MKFIIEIMNIMNYFYDLIGKFFKRNKELTPDIIEKYLDNLNDVSKGHTSMKIIKNKPVTVTTPKPIIPLTKLQDLLDEVYDFVMNYDGEIIYKRYINDYSAIYYEIYKNGKPPLLLYSKQWFGEDTKTLYYIKLDDIILKFTEEKTKMMYDHIENIYFDNNAKFRKIEEDKLALESIDKLKTFLKD